MDKLNAFLAQNLVDPAAPALLKQGQNAAVYSVMSAGQKYVVKVGYNTKQSGSSLQQACQVQQVLITHGYDHCPEVLVYDPSEDISIERFIDGEQRPLLGYTEAELDAFMTALTNLHTFDTTLLPNMQTVNLLDDIKLYGTDRLALVRESLLQEQELVSFLETELNKNIDVLKRHTLNVAKPFLIHGDIGSNCILQSDKAVLIDWEHTRLSFRNELEYIKIHSHPTPEQFSYIIQKYSEIMGIPITELEREIKIHEQVTRLNDVIWAAMRWGETKTARMPRGAISHTGATFADLTTARRDIYVNFMNGA